MKIAILPANPTVRSRTAPPVVLPNVGPNSSQPAGTTGLVDAGNTPSERNDAIDERIATAELSRLTPTDCLFCSLASPSFEVNLAHMSSIHSFFIPDAEYLVDVTGLVTYLGEKIAIGNVCIYCGDKGREFRSLEAVRKHMVDKSHCKIAYSSEADRLEVSDFYDFSSSYPGAEPDGEEWEDVDDDDEPADDVVESSDRVQEKDDSDSEDDVPTNQITYGDSDLELVLPSGARIGHRSMRRYYAQHFSRSSGKSSEDLESGAAMVRKLLANKNSALVPRKGGFGAFGSGTEVVRARNRGEAREAGRHVREFRDQKRREDFRTKVGMIHNAQKHYRCDLANLCLTDYANFDLAEIHYSNNNPRYF